MSEDLKIIVVEADRDLAFQIVDTLRDEGWRNVTVLGDEMGLARKIAALEPDLVLIDLANPSRDSLEQVSRATEADNRAVAMFVDQTDDEMTRAAMAAGLSAYVVGAPEPDRVKSVLKTAIARFQVTSQMRRELEHARQALEDRKTIDRAKGMVMRARGLSEEEAYALMRKAAMSQNRKVIDVAQALLTASDLLA
ncbi:MAG: ANTAR domain-containing protein [Litoreibacter sp.]|nr:ANTAR domain-containing protein [Litoreibacter sp.]MCY4333144.1 ANTAR domain-containing protein [Litoreibacter sp.]